MLKCFKCGKTYNINEINTKIRGTYVETICPFCSNTFHDKLLNLVDKQIPLDKDRPNQFIKASRMIKLAKLVEEHALDEFAEKKKLKKKQKEKEAV